MDRMTYFFADNWRHLTKGKNSLVKPNKKRLSFPAFIVIFLLCLRFWKSETSMQRKSSSSKTAYSFFFCCFPDIILRVKLIDVAHFLRKKQYFIISIKGKRLMPKKGDNENVDTG